MGKTFRSIGIKRKFKHNYDSNRKGTNSLVVWMKVKLDNFNSKIEYFLLEP